MKNRTKRIVNRLLSLKTIKFDQLLNDLDISRRTLYYDINKINDFIKDHGEVVINKQEIFLSGDLKMISGLYDDHGVDYEMYLKYENRKQYILSLIFEGYKVQKKHLAEMMLVSEETINETIKRIKSELIMLGVEMVYKKGYQLIGDEVAIRDVFLNIQSEFNNQIHISDEVRLFNEKTNLKLTDYSLDSLTKMVGFVKSRIKSNNQLTHVERYQDSNRFNHFDAIEILLNEYTCDNEKLYLSAYISSLSGMESNVPDLEINKIVDMLLDSIENNLLIYFRNKDECKSNLIRHIASSYNRIKYDFPIHNPLMEIIKFKYQSLFLITKSLFKDDKISVYLQGIRDEEIAFIVSYLGAYTFKESLSDSNVKRIVIVCPNGITVSKTIEYQIERYFPQVEIVDSISLSDLDTFDKPYDYVISTIPISGYPDVIMVNPILRNYDLDMISRKLFNGYQRFKEVDIEDLINGISKYADIKDETALKQILYEIIYNTQTKEEGGSPMLKETLLPSRIQFENHIDSWQEAIKLASQPLLEEKTINKEYIDAMINSLHENGPYIVLDEYFALAHARPEDGVNELSMSMLKTNESVDFLGKEVKILIVLAATDNQKHLKALASLTEMFMEKENINKIIEAQDISVVVDLINQYS